MRRHAADRPDACIRGRRPAAGRPPGRCRATGGRCPAPPRRRPTRSGSRPEPPTVRPAARPCRRSRAASRWRRLSRTGVQIVVGDPDDHPGLVDQLGDDGAQHGLRLRRALPARQVGQQLAGDGGADPDHALALAGRRVGGALHDVFKLVGQPLQRRGQPRRCRRFRRGLAVGEAVGIAVLVRLEQVGRFEDRLRRRGGSSGSGGGGGALGISASEARRSSRRRATSASNSVSNRNLRVDVMIGSDQGSGERQHQ